MHIFPVGANRVGTVNVDPTCAGLSFNHSALENAAATVMENILGEEMPFSRSSPTALPGSGARSFTGFKQAADENADSRVRAGIHFRFACDAGQEMGNKVGKWIGDHHLKPLKEVEHLRSDSEVPVV